MFAALSFLTPIGGARRPTTRTADWFPWVGLAIGSLLGGIWWGAGYLWNGPVPAALVVVADLAVTGLLHIDGLADSADGLLPHMERSRRLAVMKEPTVGAFGVGVVAAMLVLRWAALAGTRPSVLLVAGLWGLSRSVMAVVMRSQPYAREEGGLATAFAGRANWPLLASGAVASVLMLVAWRPGPGLAAAGALLLATGSVTWWARHQLGGYTGDVLGALVMVGETAGLVVAGAKW
jgi:adenosylcobinamide-GDP ribazoletransferase